jgi:hypothetical protein
MEEPCRNNANCLSIIYIFDLLRINMLPTILLFILSFSATVFAAENCVTDLAAAQKLLGENHMATTWIETTANDCKPLFIQLSTKSNKLDLVFYKNGEGFWAQGPASICPEEDKPKLSAKISKHEITVGKNTPVLVRWGLEGGADFTLTPDANGELKITTFGWGGTFVPSTEKVLAEAQSELNGKGKN